MLDYKNPPPTGDVDLALAEPNDIDKALQFAQYARGTLKAKLFLVDHSSILVAGFVDHLKAMKELRGPQDVAFAEEIYPSGTEAPTHVGVPKFAKPEKFRYVLDSLKKDSATSEQTIAFHPKDSGKAEILDNIKSSTTLDDGQSVALVENLSRRLTFTQGPPGTGKTFLGVAECEVILKSLDGQKNQGPIVVICQTNHAVDDFVKDLVKRGIKKVVRLGQNSKDEEVKRYEIHHIRNKFQGMVDGPKMREASKAYNALYLEGLKWAEAVEKDGFCILEQHLYENHAEIYDYFMLLETLDEDLVDIQKFVKNWSGSGYRYWINGGDIRDASKLVDSLDDILGPIDLGDKKSSQETLNFKNRLLEKLKTRAAKSADHPAAHIWTLDLEARKALVAEWVQEIGSDKICEMFAEMHRRFRAAVMTKFEVSDARDVNVIKNSETQILAMTSTGCARNRKLLRALKPKFLVFEEASELLEAHSLVALTPSIELCVSIGDPLQLRPHISQQALSLDRGSAYGFDLSLFERQMKTSSFSQLTVQRRAHPDMADILRNGDYPYLTDAPSTHEHPMPPGVSKRMYWWDHQQEETKPDANSAFAKSHMNSFEAECVARLVKFLIQRHGVTMNKITVLTPYNGQLELLCKRLGRVCPIELTKEDRQALVDAGCIGEYKPAELTENVPLSEMLKVATIDNYQGEQNDFVIFTAVRSNKANKVGFIKERNRRNVAVSRARCGFFIIGNAKVFKQHANWANVIEVFEKKDAIGPSLPLLTCAKHASCVHPVSTSRAISKIPECKHACAEELSCGHQCSHPCHPPEMHEDGRRTCTEKCGKLRPCGHKCEKDCGEPCRDCPVQLEPVTLGCGHSFTPLCSTNLSTVKCQAFIKKVTLACGHEKSIVCSDDEPDTCNEKCGHKLACGHGCLNDCTKCTADGKHPVCATVCGKQYKKCSHACASACHKGDCRPCTAECEKSCSHGKCGLPCSVICDPCVKPNKPQTCEHQEGFDSLCCFPGILVPCSKPCGKTLSCGLHACPGICNDECPEDCLECDCKEVGTLMPMLPCGHSFMHQQLDQLYGMYDLYNIDKDGIIISLDIKRLPSNDSMVCPTCNESVHGSQRYQFAAHIASIFDVLDRLYAKLGRKMGGFARQIQGEEKSLATDFQGLVKQLKTGPMSTGLNRQALASYGSNLEEIKQSLVKFNDEVVTPVEAAIVNLYTALGNSDLFPVPTLSFGLRFKRLSLRCRRARLESTVRVIKYLEGKKDTSTDGIAVALRDGIGQRVMADIASAQTCVAAARAKNLPRLEAEFLVTELALTAIANFVQPMHVEAAQAPHVQRLADRATALDARFQSGRLGFELADVVNRRSRRALWFGAPTGALGNAELWVRWARHVPGATALCARGHPFSPGAFGPSCPECDAGVRAEKAGSALMGAPDCQTDCECKCDDHALCFVTQRVLMLRVRK